MVQVFGIRHHGPGSAKNLLKGLNSLQPDCILIEAPNDAESVVKYIGHKDLIAPVAILIYNPKDFSQATYLPFASFSPEWQAIKYANNHSIPLRLMDLPMSIHFGWNKKEDEKLQLGIDEKKLNKEERKIHYDPIGFLGELAGYKDGERWWEVTFEQSEGFKDIFPLINNLISPLREAMSGHKNPEELLREAYMRQCIRKALQEGFKNIVVICGAWHAPVLQNWDQFKAANDKKVLRGLKKIKTNCTWIPWSFERLSRQSGYGAGVLSPAWYKLLFHQHSNVVAHWMTQVGRLFRQEGLAASSAHTIEAVRLAEALAALRHLSIPGIEELKEAAVAIFCEGDKKAMELIEKRLIIGDEMGSVLKEIPMVPLQQDLDKCIRTARLSKDRQSTDPVEKKLDLRKNANLAASLLLHRLNIMGIPWGKEGEISHLNTGSFTENWKLYWQPEFAIRIIEAGMWGNTVFEAATNKALKEAENSNNLSVVTMLIGEVLKADLADAIDPLIQRFQHLSALTKDVEMLMEALPPLVSAIRYGSTRKLNLQSLNSIVNQIIPRICIGLPLAALPLNEDAAKDLFSKLIRTNHAISTLNHPEHNLSWNEALSQIATTPSINGMLTGSCTRLLFEKNRFSTSKTATLMLFHLSKGNPPLKAAQWLEGFLFGSGLLLIHNKELWEILNKWVENIPMLLLQDLLPLLRRTFSKFPPAERQKMLEMAKKQKGSLANLQEEQTNLVNSRAEMVVPVVQLLLGK